MATVYRDVSTGQMVSAPSAYPIYRVVYYLLDIVEVLLAVRFIFRLIGASTVSSFANLVYNITAPLVAPFFGILGSSVTNSGAVFEWPTVVAMIAYAIIAYIIVRLIAMIAPSDEVPLVE